MDGWEWPIICHLFAQITDLKIDNNPWAKGFRDGRESKRQNKGQCQNGGPDEKMNNKMEEAAKQPTYDNEIQLYINSLLEKGQQQQKPMKKPTEWSMDLTSISGDGNGQNALKGQKREVIQLAYNYLLWKKSNFLHFPRLAKC
jgi:hypothetical protein